MRKGFLLASLLFAFPVAAQTQDSAILSQWVQLAPGGGSEARIVTTAATCPAITVDGASLPMTERAAPNAYFAVHLCAAAIPAGAKSAAVNGAMLPLFHANPQRIMVFGDTGCRIKG